MVSRNHLAPVYQSSARFGYFSHLEARTVSDIIVVTTRPTPTGIASDERAFLSLGLLMCIRFSFDRLFQVARELSDSHSVRTFVV